MSDNIDRDVVVEDFDAVLAADAVECRDTENFTDRIKEDFSIQITCDRKLTQEVADLIELDLKTLNNDHCMRVTEYGRQQYFGCYVPKEYIITSNGVWWMQQKRVLGNNGYEMIDVPIKVCGTRLMPTGQFISSEGIHFVELTFVNDNLKIESLRVPLNATQGTKEWKDIIRKNNYSSLFITDNELKNVIDYIRAARDANLHEGGTAYKYGEVFTHTGWVDKNYKKFVLGSTMIAEDEYGRITTSEAIFIDERNIGFEEKLQPNGTLDGWIKAVSPIVKNNIFRFKMYYDTAAIVLGYLGVSNSAFGMVGDTSIGKTFTMQCSTSMFGNPNVKGEGLIISGDISLTALNAMLTTLVDIPAPVDEITVMKEDVKKALTYAIGNGSESLRGTKEGDLRSHKKIRTNVTLTGESDITSELANNGANVRAFTCKEKPLPDMDPNRIDEMRAGVLENYGHILPRLIIKFFESRKNLKIWYNFALTRLRKTTEDSLAKRKAEYFAAAEVGGRLLEAVFKEIDMQPAKVEDIIDEMWSDFVLDMPDIPLAVKALESAYNWAMSHPANFLRGDQLPAEKNPAPIYGFFTYPPYQNNGEYEFIDFIPSELEKFLKDRGYDNKKQIIRWWLDHDILQSKASKKVKSGKEPAISTYHIYAYGTAPERKDAYRVKISKVREYVETGELDDNEIEKSKSKPTHYTNHLTKYEQDLEDYNFAYGK